jgi:hypothetical protein
MRNDSLIMNSEFKRMWEEQTKVCFKVVYWMNGGKPRKRSLRLVNLPGKTETRDLPNTKQEL